MKPASVMSRPPSLRATSKMCKSAPKGHRLGLGREPQGLTAGTAAPSRGTVGWSGRRPEVFALNVKIGRLSGVCGPGTS